MKKVILILIVSVVFGGGTAFAITDVNETAGYAFVGGMSISSSAATAISSNVVTNVFAYNICNEDSTNKIRCGYNTSVSTVAGNANQGFWVKPTECEYRAISGITPYCQAEGSAAINITREIFGKP